MSSIKESLQNSMKVARGDRWRWILDMCEEAAKQGKGSIFVEDESVEHSPTANSLQDYLGLKVEKELRPTRQGRVEGFRISWED